MHDRIPPESCNLFKFWYITDILEIVQDIDIVTMKGYQTAPIPMTLSDIEGHFCFF